MKEFIENSDEEKNLKSQIGTASFAITARVAMQLGRESISNSITAIVELVKNAYDADAEHVLIAFIGLDTNQPTLIIDDDGSGMNYQQLMNSWFVIGTDNKVVEQKSKKKKRTLTGEKGLGRLGLDRLCEITQVQTFVESEPQGIEIDINWKKYDHTNEKLETISHNIYRISKDVNDPVKDCTFLKNKGTRLVLKGLKDNWLEELENLRTELALLVSPFAGINDFSISLYTGRFKTLDGQVVSDDLLNAAEWKISSTLNIVDQEAILDFIMTSNTTGAQITQKATWNNAMPEERNRMPMCGPIKFDYYFMRRKDFPALSLKKAQIERFLNNNQGIRIYRDAIRVMPYGKPSGDGDWLTLSFRQTRSPAPITGPVGSWKVGYNQGLGAVFIGREANPILLDQTNREGIVEGPPYYDMRKFALWSISTFERNFQKYEKAQGPQTKNDEFEKAKTVAEESRQKTTRVTEDVKSNISSALETILDASLSRTLLEDKTDSEIKKNVGIEISATVSKAIEEITQTVVEQQSIQQSFIEAADKREEERQEEFQRQKDTLGNLASLGILATTFGHETLASSNLVLNNSQELMSVMDQFRTGEFVALTPEEKNRIKQCLDDMEHGAGKINTFANFTLRNVTRDKRQRNKIILGQLIKKVFKTFESSLEEQHEIKVIFDFAASIPPINAFYIDWESIIVNFLTNSVYVLDNTVGIERIIRVRLQEDGELLHLSFADSGYGIAEGTEEDIFQPTFSTRKNRTGDVTGTGMGLAIVQNFVLSYNGTMYVKSPCDLGGAEFHIKVPVLKQ